MEYVGQYNSTAATQHQKQQQQRKYLTSHHKQNGSEGSPLQGKMQVKQGSKNVLYEPSATNEKYKLRKFKV